MNDNDPPTQNRDAVALMIPINAVLPGSGIWQILTPEGNSMKPSELFKCLMVLVASGTLHAAPGPLPVPDSDAIGKKEKLVRDVFGNYSVVPLPERHAIAVKMVEQALATTDDPVARYALLKDAGDLAASAGDAATAMRAANLLADQYAINGGELKLGLLAAPPMPPLRRMLPRVSQTRD